MRRGLSIPVALAGLLLGTGAVAQQQPGSTAPGETAQVIQVTAKKYEFNPGEIHVKKSTKVQLKLRALDHTHGFKIALYPEGAEEKGSPGLRLTSPQGSWKIEKGQEVVIEFAADRTGTYPFRCAHFCGLGHGGMKGKLVVEE